MKKKNSTSINNSALAQKKQRIWELDFIRGVCVLLMIFDHAMVDIADVFGRAWANAHPFTFYSELLQNAKTYLNSDLRTNVQIIVVIIFATVCGISCSFSRNNLKRGIEVAVCAGLITLVTSLEAIDMPILFGILHMLAVAILLWWLINTICRKDKHRTAVVCLVVGIAIICIDAYMSERFRLKLFQPETSRFAFLADWMIGDRSFYSADYYPVFPYVGYMLLGASVAPLIYPNRKSLIPILGKYNWYYPFSFWGKIALWVYIFHQVVITAIFSLISYFFITPGDLVFF